MIIDLTTRRDKKKIQLGKINESLRNKMIDFN